MTDDNDDKPTGEVIHFNPWRDFNDAPLQEDPFGVEPDAEQLGVFLDVVFGYCEGLIPVRGFVDKGQGRDGTDFSVGSANDNSHLRPLTLPCDLLSAIHPPADGSCLRC